MSRRRLGEAGAGGEMKAEEVGFALADGERHEALPPAELRERIGV